MSLNKDIQQKEFRNEYQKAIINILYTHNHVVSFMGDVFKQFDITRQQYNVLRILRGQYPKYATVNIIKDRMLDKMSDTSRLVERLRLKEFITRTNCELDKRAAEIRITTTGLSLLEKMQQPVDEFENLLHNLSEEEILLLNSLLDKVRGTPTENNLEENVTAELLYQPEKI